MRDAARKREIELPGMVLMPKAQYATYVLLALLAGLLLGWMIWGAS